MIAIIAGSRSITSRHLVGEAIRESGWWDEITEVVSGGARGVDTIGEEWCKRFLGKDATVFLPVYDHNDPKSILTAPLVRNASMAKYVQENGGGALIAVWRPDSRDVKKGGTANMILNGHKHGLRVFVKVVGNE